VTGHLFKKTKKQKPSFKKSAWQIMTSSGHFCLASGPNICSSLPSHPVVFGGFCVV
jgi:hypothetical protein